MEASEMPPPPVIPSPHRFVVKKEPARRTPLAQAHTPHPSTQQFNATPRFTISSTAQPTATQTLPSPTQSAARFSAPASKASRARDVISNSSDDLPHNIHDSIEIDEDDADLEYGSVNEEDDHKLEERTPKRRRVSSPLILDDDEEPDLLENEQLKDEQQDSLSSSLPILSSPPAPRRAIPSTAPRFLLSNTLPPSTPQPENPAQSTFLKPPRFRPPDPSDDAQTATDPLPEQFSPHRKGQKYVPGGLAAEVRDWLFHIESAIPTHKNKDDPWVVKILVDDVRDGGKAGMTLIRGRQVHHAGDGQRGLVDHMGVGVVSVMLAGEGQAVGLQRGTKIEVGKMVGIKGPAWEVVVDGVKWGVGVDWKVLG